MTKTLRLAIRGFAVLLLTTLAQAQSYNVTDLGGVNSLGLAISPSGNVVGETDSSSGFFWSPSHGFLQLPGVLKGTFSEATAINATGVIAGQATVNVQGFELAHAVLWTNGKIKDLGTLTTLGQSWATGINAAGQVTGAANPYGSNPHAFLWTSATGIQDLGTLSGGSYSTGLAINKFGQIAGYSDLASGVSVAFLWSKATGMQDLATLPGGGGSSANAINDFGQVAGGSSCGAACDHAVLWSKTRGSVQDLGVLPGTTFSNAYGMNNLGQVVGAAGYISSYAHAFVWSQAGVMQDLNALIPANSGWLLLYAFAINDKGQITGEGIVNGAMRAFLLTPVARDRSN